MSVINKIKPGLKFIIHGPKGRDFDAEIVPTTTDANYVTVHKHTKRGIAIELYGKESLARCFIRGSMSIKVKL